jgi:hypothetical protein
MKKIAYIILILISITGGVYYFTYPIFDLEIRWEDTPSYNNSIKMQKYIKSFDNTEDMTKYCINITDSILTYKKGTPNYQKSNIDGIVSIKEGSCGHYSKLFEYLFNNCAEKSKLNARCNMVHVSVYFKNKFVEYHILNKITNGNKTKYIDTVLSDWNLSMPLLAKIK